MQAFYSLGTERSYVIGLGGGAIGPIPWTKAIFYAEKFGLSQRGQFWFADVIMCLDGAWRERRKEDEEKEKKREERRQRRKALIQAGKRGR